MARGKKKRNKSRNPHAKALTSKLFRVRVVPNKKKDVKPEE